MTETVLESHVNIRLYRIQEKLKKVDPLVGGVFSSFTGNIQDSNGPSACRSGLLSAI